MTLWETTYLVQSSGLGRYQRIRFVLGIGAYSTVTTTPPYSVPITTSHRYYRVLEN